MNAQSRMRVMQLASQALPIGGYSHSHGLESAIEAGVVCDEQGLLRWMSDLLSLTLSRYEIPMLCDFFDGWKRRDVAGVDTLNQEFLATRESAELRSASVQMGYSLHQLTGSLPDTPAWLTAALHDLTEPTLPCVWSALSVAWGVERSDTVAAYAWSWAENQMLVALKAVPLGQSAGQRVLLQVGALIAQLDCIATDELAVQAPYSNFAPALAILSAQHETQYSRLFRS
jgi:urease accessory protein